MAPLSIALIGAGPAGLTFARILRLRLQTLPPGSIDLTIFERDENQHSQTEQIGTLDLHEDTGLKAMKAAGLWEEFLKHARYDGEELVIADKNCTEMVHMVPGGKTTPGVEESRPEIDRKVLVDVLLNSVGKDSIRWGMKLRSVSQDGLLTFADGSTSGPYDLVVGADGSWSKVRPLLSDVKPSYSGICGFESLIVNPDENHPQISKLLGRGAYFAFSDCKAMMAHRLGTNDIKLNYWMRQDENYHTGEMRKAGGDEGKLRRNLLELYKDWTPELRDCIPASSHFRSRALYELPVGDEFEHRKGFTLLGDAAHVMTPFSGKGANAAMRDAVDLAEALIENLHNGGEWDYAIKDYERQMFVRSSKVQALTAMHRTYMFEPDAPIGFMVQMVDVIAEAKGKKLDAGILRWIPVRKTVFLIASSMVWIGWTRRAVLQLLKAVSLLT